ncbi:MAG: AmmeMemoRadiSam system protein A [Pseudomonadales bacterium]
MRLPDHDHETVPGYPPAQRRLLLDIARRSVERAVRLGAPLAVDVEALPEPLRAVRASFVTLTREGRLRGCIGTLEGHRPLAQDVAGNAFDTALNDPRFNPVTGVELDLVRIELSILSPMEPLEVTSERQLLAGIRPFVDGLVIDDGIRRATFLPKVWESLPEPQAFVRALKRKAGMPDEYWPAQMRTYRYHSETFSEAE